MREKWGGSGTPPEVKKFFKIFKHKGLQFSFCVMNFLYSSLFYLIFPQNFSNFLIKVTHLVAVKGLFVRRFSLFF